MLKKSNFVFYDAYYELGFYSEARLPEVPLFCLMFLSEEDFLTVAPSLSFEPESTSDRN